MTIGEQIAHLAASYSGEKFMEIPDEWFESPHWWCDNGHRSMRYLKSERLGGGVAWQGRSLKNLRVLDNE